MVSALGLTPVSSTSASTPRRPAPAATVAVVVTPQPVTRRPPGVDFGSGSRSALVADQRGGAVGDLLQGGQVLRGADVRGQLGRVDVRVVDDAEVLLEGEDPAYRRVDALLGELTGPDGVEHGVDRRRRARGGISSMSTPAFSASTGTRSSPYVSLDALPCRARR